MVVLLYVYINNNVATLKSNILFKFIVHVIPKKIARYRVIYYVCDGNLFVRDIIILKYLRPTRLSRKDQIVDAIFLCQIPEKK